MFERRCVEELFVDGSLVGCCSSHDSLIVLCGHLGDSGSQSSLHLCLLKLHLVMAASKKLVRLVYLRGDPIDTQTWVL